MKKIFCTFLMIITSCFLFVACGGSGGNNGEEIRIKSLQEYKTVIDGYVYATVGSELVDLSTLAGIQLDSFNFMFEIEQYEDGEKEMSVSVRVDGDKVLFVHSYLTGEPLYTAYTYFDGEFEYCKRVLESGELMHDWKLEEDTHHTAALFISAFQSILDPEKYDKTEGDYKHTYTLKEGVVLYGMEEEDIVTITITKDDLVVEQVGEMYASIAKITIGGQTVKQPSDFNL